VENGKMDAKVTLSFDEGIVNRAKRYAEKNNISLSRLVEFLLQKTTAANYSSLEDLPISDWVNVVAEGQAVYQTKKKTRKSARAEYYSSKK
jgi:hypothetical protein